MAEKEKNRVAMARAAARYPYLAYVVGAYFHGEFSFGEEVDELVETEESRVATFIREARAALDDADGEAVSALIRNEVNWCFGSEHDTLREMLHQVEQVWANRSGGEGSGEA